MLLNIEKFTTYSKKFNQLIDKINMELDNILGSSIKIISENEIKDIIYTTFPKDWIIYGEYKTSVNYHYILNYYKVGDLNLKSLHYLQDHINNVENMIDTSYQTLQDFDQFDLPGL